MSSQTLVKLSQASTPHDFVFSRRIGSLKSAIVVSVLVAFLANSPGSIFGQIVKPDDAPKPLSPAETGQRFTVPPGFRVELVACEPLVREPSGVCWDERGDLYVCELHGYNVEGQYDIEELNKTGQLDRVVRRIQADERHKKAAEAETYGTIKRLKDTDGDGRMDRAEVWADRLPACLGICPARGGIIAACQTEILFLADRDGDGKAEIKEILFEGFKLGPLERSINSPQFGPDNWIYFGRGAGGGTITGKYLSKVVELPNTDFRIKPDGTAIEPIVGNTGTMGFAFTESGDRFVISTGTPGIFVAPIEWRYLARNPDIAAPTLPQSGTTDQRVYPTSRPHPWRERPADDPGFAKLYTNRYGIQESAPNGFFTSACSPLVYQDSALPGLHGQLLACEPAQNLVHRAIIERDGSQLTLHRDLSEAKSEFLSSSDSWFHAIALSPAPDGNIYIVDFYREIIEDYSAIPRYLQQQYGLVAGKDHGRIWRLTHEAASLGPLADMSQVSPEQLAAEVGSSLYWRRTTARRLLIERKHKHTVPILVKMLAESKETAALHNAMHTLHGLEALGATEVMSALTHSDASVRRQALRFAEQWLDDDPTVLTRVLALAFDVEPLVRLQLALSLGETRDARALRVLADLGRKHGDEKWMTTAILSAVPTRGGDLLAELLRIPGELGQGETILEPLCTAIANRRVPAEISNAIDRIAVLDDRRLQTDCLRGVHASFKRVLRKDVEELRAMSVSMMPEDMFKTVGPKDLADLISWLRHPPADWVLETKDAMWTPRDSQGEFVFRDRLWILGGWFNSNEAPPRDVWSSADGAQWNLVTEKAPWLHSDLPMSVVFKDRMWMMGGWYNGRLPGHSASNAVWSSLDGIRWEQVTPAAGWSPRIAAGLVEHLGRLWMLGGTENYYFGDDKSLKNDVWSSADGIAWDLVVANAAWSPRAYHQSVVLNDRIYLFGGGNYVPSHTAKNDVWSSVDGVNWTCETESAPWEPRLWFSAAVYRGRIWVLGGWSKEKDNFGDVWHSADGKAWQRLKTKNCWKARHEHSVFVHKDKLWVAGGHARPLSNEVWSLNLPKEWKP